MNRIDSRKQKITHPTLPPKLRNNSRPSHSTRNLLSTGLSKDVVAQDVRDGGSRTSSIASRSFHFYRQPVYLLASKSELWLYSENHFAEQPFPVILSGNLRCFSFTDDYPSSFKIMRAIMAPFKVSNSPRCSPVTTR